MSKIGFLFDLDGTLVDSQEAVMNSWITMANEAGIPLQALAGHHGVPAEQTLRKVLADREEAEGRGEAEEQSARAAVAARSTELAISLFSIGEAPLPQE